MSSNLFDIRTEIELFIQNNDFAELEEKKLRACGKGAIHEIEPVEMHFPLLISSIFMTTYKIIINIILLKAT